MEPSEYIRRCHEQIRRHLAFAKRFADVAKLLTPYTAGRSQMDYMVFWNVWEAHHWHELAREARRKYRAGCWHGDRLS